MKETEWRHKIVKDFKEKKMGFVWVHDAHFKHGFPDLTIVQSGVEAHVELKVVDHQGLDPMKLLSPRQRFVAWELTEAGANVFCVALAKREKTIFVYKYVTENSWWVEPQVFKLQGLGMLFPLCH